MSRTEKPFVSLVIPVYNEADSIDSFVEAATAVMRETGCPYEMVFVNDGSADSTLEALRAARAHCREMVIISLSRNFGKEGATTAGLDFAKGDVVVPIDVDLQDPPQLIHQFLERWREGYDVVYGVRVDRATDSWVKRKSAGWFYKLFNRLSRVRIPENAGDFRLLDRRVVDEINKLRERNRFMKGLMAWPGFKSIGVPFERPERAAGMTSWNYWKLWSFALDGLTSFSTVPIRLWTYFGASLALISFAFAGYIMVRVLIAGVDVPGYASMIVAVMFFGGIQLMSLGVIGEYVGRIFEEVKSRPIYIIDSIESGDD